jgi:hypothetical protein
LFYRQAPSWLLGDWVLKRGAEHLKLLHADLALVLHRSVGSLRVSAASAHGHQTRSLDAMLRAAAPYPVVGREKWLQEDALFARIVGSGVETSARSIPISNFLKIDS